MQYYISTSPYAGGSPIVNFGSAFSQASIELDWIIKECQPCYWHDDWPDPRSVPLNQPMKLAEVIDHLGVYAQFDAIDVLGYCTSSNVAMPIFVVQLAWFDIDAYYMRAEDQDIVNDLLTWRKYSFFDELRILENAWTDDLTWRR